MTNEELYRRVQAGDTGSFDQLYGQMENFIRANALDAARRFGCTDAAGVANGGSMCRWEP